MDDLTAHMRRVFQVTLFFLALCLLVWAFVPGVRSIAAGLALGTAGSMINAQYLAVRIQRFTREIVENTGKRVGLGMVTRICVAILAVMIAVKSEQVDLVAVVIGLFFTQLVTLLTGLLSVFHK